MNMRTLLTTFMIGDCGNGVKSIFLALFLFGNVSVSWAVPAEPSRISGEITGEVTATSAILQSRLTMAEKAPNGEVYGQAGWARFVISRHDDFSSSEYSNWLEAKAEQDFIVKHVARNLLPNTQYYYRLEYGTGIDATQLGDINRFITLAGETLSVPISFAHVTCMTYEGFHIGVTRPWYASLLGGRVKSPYEGSDKHLGYPGLVPVASLKPQFVIFNGDNVYYDHGPEESWGKDLKSMRFRWHRQFSQPRFLDLFKQTSTYWTKDDHDFRYNDGDRTVGKKPTLSNGLSVFREQVPVVDPGVADAKTYRTHRVSKDLQMWYLEGRDYRSPNDQQDGPNKTMWGNEQKAWLKQTLLESDATFKIVVSPTPLVGPDRRTKNDNHVNNRGFRHEGQAFLDWLKDNRFDQKGLYLLVGDRHWQYHSIDPRGFEEFSSGSFSYVNAQKPQTPGGYFSSDPDGLIQQPYASPEAMGGFIQVNIDPMSDSNTARLVVRFMHESGKEMYRVERAASH